MVGGGKDGRVTIWDAKSDQVVLSTMECHSQGIAVVEVSPDSTRVASSAEDGSVALWSLVTGELLAGPVNLGGGDICFLQFSPSGDRLAGTHHADQSTVYIWDHHLVELIKVPYTSPGWLDRVKWLDDRGERLIAGSHESHVIIDTITKTTDWKRLGAIDVSANGKFMLSFTWGTGAEIWDSATYTHIGPPRILCHPFALSPDDCLLVGGALKYLGGPSQPSTISLWNLRDLLPKSYTIAVSNVSHTPCDSYSKTNNPLPELAPSL